MNVTSIRVQYERAMQPAPYETSKPLTEYTAALDEGENPDEATKKLMGMAVGATWAALGRPVPAKVAEQFGLVEHDPTIDDMKAEKIIAEKIRNDAAARHAAMAEEGRQNAAAIEALRKATAEQKTQQAYAKTPEEAAQAIEALKVRSPDPVPEPEPLQPAAPPPLLREAFDDAIARFTEWGIECRGPGRKKAAFHALKWAFGDANPWRGLKMPDQSWKNLNAEHYAKLCEYADQSMGHGLTPGLAGEMVMAGRELAPFEPPPAIDEDVDGIF